MIRFDKVTKGYGGIPIVHQVDFHVPAGELCVLIGPSGSGKSTLLRMINRLLSPDSGDIYIDERDSATIPPEKLRRGIGYVIQSTGLFPHLTVGENIAVVPKLLHWPKSRIVERTKQLIEMIGLNEDYLHKYPRHLSGGEAQRVGLARALAADPPILLMDEPFASVDPVIRKKLQEEFRKIQQQLQKTVLFVTHDVDEAVLMADKIAFLKDGRLESKLTPEAYATVADAEIKDFLGEEYGLKLLSRFRVDDVMRPTAQECQGKCIPKGSSLRAALAVMISEEIPFLSVVIGEKACGILYLEDIVEVLRNAIE